MSFKPADHSKGDANTIGGYAAVHDRPAAFEGSDNASYSVEIVVDEVGTGAQRFGGYLCFVRWGFGGMTPSGHLETDYLEYGASDDEVRAQVGRLMLNQVKQILDALIRG